MTAAVRAGHAGPSLFGGGWATPSLLGGNYPVDGGRRRRRPICTPIDAQHPFHLNVDNSSNRFLSASRSGTAGCLPYDMDGVCRRDVVVGLQIPSRTIGKVVQILDVIPGVTLNESSAHADCLPRRPHLFSSM
jgi:hypothetical protein